MKTMSLKHFVFSFLILLISISFFWRLSLFFILPSPLYLLQVGIIYLMLLVFIPLFFLLIDNRYFVYSTIFLSIFSFLLFFSFSEIYVLSGFLALLLCILGYEFSRREKEQRIKLSFRRSCSRGLKLVVMAISLLLAVIYYFNPFIAMNQQELEIPSQAFRPLINLSNEIISNSLPSGLKETGLIDLENKEIEIEVAQKVNQGLKGFIEPYYQEISIGLAVALFFVLRFVGIIFTIVSIILSRIIFYILFICKIIKIDSEMKPTEVIKF